MPGHAIQLAHGSGGRLTAELIDSLFIRHFDNPALRRREDQAILDGPQGRIAFTTDSYVVDPIFFPGGDIGALAVNGTVNDLCMGGARPLYLSAGFIIEEGLPRADLERIVRSMRRAADLAGVQIVTGDTKVVNHGKGDKVFINTAGIGILEHPFAMGADRLSAGDRVLLSGAMGNHGVAVLSCREGLAFESPIESDTAALHDLVATLVEMGGDDIHAMRDPTRGGVAATLNEFATASGMGILLFEEALPVDPPVAGACELLGLDPLYVANEGRVIVVVSAAAEERLLRVLRGHPLGQAAVCIGCVRAEEPGRVTLRTRLGTERIIDLPLGEPLPRIC